MYCLNLNYDRTEWRLFRDSPKLSFKAVLLHIGNSLPFVPIGHGDHMKETYINMKVLLSSINYNEQKWKI